ncbi:MAG: hypothetical protein ACX98W_12910 [bacterium]
MPYELRPLSLAEILDAAFRLVQTQWRTLVGLSFVMQLPLVLMGYWAQWLFDPFAEPIEPGDELTTGILLEMGGVLTGMSLVYLILYPFVAASVTASVARFYLGREFSLGEAARVGLRSLAPLVASYLVYLGAVFGAFLVVGLLGVAAGALLGELAPGLGAVGTLLRVGLGLAAFALLFFVLLFVAALASLLPPVSVLESAGVVGTVRRAFALAGGARGRVVLVVISAGLLVGIPVGAAQALIGFVPVLGLLTWGLLQAVGFAFTTAVAVVLYFDLRCRAEHYDLELLAEQVEAGSSLADR